MSKYTTELRFVCETLSGLSESVGYDNTDEVIANAREKIFNFSYPIFDSDYKSTLETKILQHYYTREIGLETFGQWKRFLQMRMNEIMPYYNKLYESELIEFNPLDDVNYTREGNRIGNETNNVEGSGTVNDTGTITDNGTHSSGEGGTTSVSGANVPKNDTWTLYSDTPQGGVAGISAAEASVGSNAYLTNATHVISDATGSTHNETTTHGRTETGTDGNTRTLGTTRTTQESRDGTSDREEEYFERIKGKMGNKSYMSLINELRSTFLNIDMMIIDELSDLFMSIY